MLCAAECADGYFGRLCNNTCHCYDETEVCDKATGHCESGCMAGWTDADCQTGQRVGRGLFVFVHSAYRTESFGLLHMFIDLFA